MPLTRREFLAGANAAALLLLLESCNLGPIGRSAASPSGAAGGRPFEQALSLLRTSLQSSPDHLVARAAEAVATHDASKIVEFVRSSIFAVPPLFPSDDAWTAPRWGSRATLRGGLGTLRDRAELLADLLNQAGFKATVQIATRPPSLTVDSIYRARPLTFQPDSSRMNQAKALLTHGGFPSPSPSPGQFAAGPDPVAAIMAALPGSLQVADVRDSLLPANVPVVVFTDGSHQRYAFAIGDLGTVDAAPPKLVPRAADAMRSITISVSAIANPGLGGTTPRGKVVELLSATWPADEVVGRQTLLTFQPPQGGKAILDSGLAALPLRAPMLWVQGAKGLVSIGKMITVHGDVLGPAESTSTTGPYGSLKLLSGSDRSGALARVKTVAARVNSTAFPEIELSVSLTDSSGAPVDGLDAASFSVKEQGAAVSGFALYSNTAVQARPRVLVVYDAYVSFAPRVFASAAAKTAFESALAKTITGQAAKTPFDVQVVPIGASPNAGSWASPSASALASAFAAASELSDDPWGTVGGPALDQNISAIVMVSDFDSVDTDPSRLASWKRRLVASGVPVYAIPAGAIDSATADAIVSLSGGSRLGTSDLSPLPGLLAGVVSRWISNAYRIRYRAQRGDPAQRTVTVTAAQGQGTATYTVPSTPLPAPGFSGLYVTIKFGVLTATRRLAGVELSSSSSPLGALDDPAVAAEVAAALDGITTIAIEGGTPTTSAVFDDVFASLQSMAPLEALPPNATSDQFLHAQKVAIARTPLALPSLLRPVPVDPGSVPGLRVAIIQNRALGTASLEEHADLAVGLNEIVPLASDRRAAFKSALTTSVAMSAAEAATYSDSAYKRVSGQGLVGVQAGDLQAFNAWLKTVPASRRGAWSPIARVYDGEHLALPVAGGADALWVLDPHTGVGKAVLLDSTGGGIGREGGEGGGKCHISGEDGEALALGAMSLECAAAGEEWPLFCTSVNTMASGMCVIQLFEGKGDLGTPVGAIQPWLGLGEAGFGWLDAAIGMCLIMITLSSANCI
jgi:hypothetical protein